MCFMSSKLQRLCVTNTTENTATWSPAPLEMQNYVSGKGIFVPHSAFQSIVHPPVSLNLRKTKVIMVHNFFELNINVFTSV